MDGWIDDSRHQTHLVQEAMGLLPALDPAAAGELAWHGRAALPSTRSPPPWRSALGSPMPLDTLS